MERRIEVKNVCKGTRGEIETNGKNKKKENLNDVLKENLKHENEKGGTKRINNNKT